MEHKITLITGGARSGKSSYALQLGAPFLKKAYVATAQALDGEMHERIEKHRQERGDAFVTFEAPLELSQTLDSVSAKFDFVLVDCLTLWISNLLLAEQGAASVEASVENFLKALTARRSRVVLVSNEVGMGIVPDNPLARKFRDYQGNLNQRVAEKADEVILMVSGLPVFVKREEPSYAAV